MNIKNKTIKLLIVGCVAANLLVVGPKVLGVDDPMKPKAPQVKTPTISPVVVNVSLRAGGFTGLGAGPGKGLRKPGATTENTTETHTLVIELLNRTPSTLENLQVRYTVYKVTTTYSTSYNYRYGQYQYEQTSRESVPTAAADGAKAVSLKAGQREVITAEAKIRINENDSTRTIYDQWGRPVASSPGPQDQIYGYLVEVTHNGELVAEKFSPTTIREDIRGKKRN